MSGAIPFDVSSNTQRYPLNLRRYVTNNTASRTLRYRETGSTQTNYGASGSVVLTLPANADKGIYFQIKVAAAQTFTVRPDSGSVLIIGGSTLSAGLGTAADDEGECLEIECISKGVWLATSVVGTWTNET